MKTTRTTLAIWFFVLSSAATALASPIAFVIHGGAGRIERSEFTEAREREYRQTLERALDAGYAVLKEGGSSLDAVEAAIVLMEDSPFPMSIT